MIHRVSRWLRDPCRSVATPGAPGPDVVAALAHALRMMPARMSVAEQDATQAEREHRLERRGHEDQRDAHVRRDRGAEREVQHERRDRERGADALGKALRRSGYELRRDGQTRRDHVCDEPAERAETWTRRDAGDEAVGERNQQDRRGRPSVATHMATTPAATRRAETLFTGSGKPNISPMLTAKPDPRAREWRPPRAACAARSHARPHR